MSILKYIGTAEKDKTDIGKEEGFPDKAIAYIMSGIIAASQTISKENAHSEPEKTSYQEAKNAAEPVRIALPENKIRHYDLYITDGYINISSGAWPPAGDNTAIPNWNEPISQGFTDLIKYSKKPNGRTSRSLRFCRQPCRQCQVPGPFS
jgi:hypothetical protein